MARGEPSGHAGYVKESWSNDRPYIMPNSRLQNPISQPQGQPHSPHLRPQTISAALRDCVRIPVKEFALIAVCENGEVQTYASPSLSKHHEKIFSDGFKSTFTRAVHRAAADGNFGVTGYGQDNSMYNQFELDSGNEPRQCGTSSSDSGRGMRKNARSEDSDDDGSRSTRRVRRRYGGRAGDNPSDVTLKPVPSRRTQNLEIGNSEEVEAFYNTRFKDMQQTACKVMGKAFIKLVEPKKQTHHPYTKGAPSAPSWWPLQVGEDHVRHREPDHLYRKERIKLLVHILRMIVQPYSKQHPSVQKGGLTVRKLEEVTNEAMSIFFNDTDHPQNRNKKAYLKEIFKVAKMEERYLNGEIDGDAKVPVMFGDRSIADTGDESEDEGLGYDTPPSGAEDDMESKCLAAGIPTPESMPLVSPPLSQHQQLHQNEVDPMRMRLPLRYNPQPLETQTQFGDNSYYTRTLDSFQQSPTMQEPVRRSFTPQEYQPNQHSALGWQQQTMSAGGSVNGTYYTHASLPPRAGPIYPMTHTLPPPHTSVGPHFEGLASGRYDPNAGSVPGSQFRTTGLGQPHQMSAHTFEPFLQNNEGAFSHNSEDMKDEHHHLQHSG